MRATVGVALTRHCRRPTALACDCDAPPSSAASAKLRDARRHTVVGAGAAMGFCSRGLCNSNPVEEPALEFTGHRSDQSDKASSCSLPNDQHQKEKEQQDYSDEDVEEIYRILSSSDDWGSLQQALEMRSVHFGPSLVDAVLKRCKRNNRAALQFFSWVRYYCMPTTKTYNTAMKLAGSAKDFKHMRYLYKEMLRTGCSPTVDTWNVMVCQYGNADLSEKALQTFYDMKQDGFLPDKTTYNHLIMYLTQSEGRKVDDAVKIFQEMCRSGHMIDKDILFINLKSAWGSAVF
ncbi:hypothetical protein PR202_ga31292 [Eleusine coracana subsp. coracana]|uniref:Pentatricopeptide repeat-containing protein n=1 Tax=Eleusine coracana subsp. coracana TaxID=191504 RepID=A0AAV5DQZ7_ELECO|nr:hypothetical protein PR202_ga31292 [Eleusine coracana subsp. coracana]